MFKTQVEPRTADEWFHCKVNSNLNDLPKLSTLEKLAYIWLRSSNNRDKVLANVSAFKSDVFATVGVVVV